MMNRIQYTTEPYSLYDSMPFSRIENASPFGKELQYSGQPEEYT